MKTNLKFNCWLEGEIHGGKISKGQRLISDKGNVVAMFSRDLTVEETKHLGDLDSDYIDLVQ